MDNFAGLWLTDYIGSFLAAGGNGVYYFNYLPVSSDLGCGNSPGTFGMFHTDRDYTKLQPLAQFFASVLINTQWIEPGSGMHEMFSSTPTLNDGAGHALVTAYTLKRPDGQYSVMLVNRDQNAAHAIHIVFEDAAVHSRSAFTGDVDTAVFGREQYAWHPGPVRPMAHPSQLGEMVVTPDTGYADPDGPPKYTKLPMAGDTPVTVPAASIMVVRGHIAPIS